MCVILKWQHIMCKPTNLYKLGNYQSGPLDVDPMDGMRGLKRKKKGRRVGDLNAKNHTSHLIYWISL